VSTRPYGLTTEVADDAGGAYYDVDSMIGKEPEVGGIARRQTVVLGHVFGHAAQVISTVSPMNTVSTNSMMRSTGRVSRPAMLAGAEQWWCGLTLTHAERRETPGPALWSPAFPFSEGPLRFRFPRRGRVDHRPAAPCDP
jgi:hypothetical protein